jgi:hypothetical protein
MAQVELKSGQVQAPAVHEEPFVVDVDTKVFDLDDAFFLRVVHLGLKAGACTRALFSST